jgi:hypothetical protein
LVPKHTLLPLGIVIIGLMSFIGTLSILDYQDETAPALPRIPAETTTATTTPDPYFTWVPPRASMPRVQELQQDNNDYMVKSLGDYVAIMGQLTALANQLDDLYAATNDTATRERIVRLQQRIDDALLLTPLSADGKDINPDFLFAVKQITNAINHIDHLEDEEAHTSAAQNEGVSTIYNLPFLQGDQNEGLTVHVKVLTDDQQRETEKVNKYLAHAQSVLDDARVSNPELKSEIDTIQTMVTYIKNNLDVTDPDIQDKLNDLHAAMSALAYEVASDLI